MMLEPSIDTLMDKVSSKYMLVTLSAQRARALQETQSSKSEDGASRKYVGIALREIIAGELVCDSEEQK